MNLAYQFSRIGMFSAAMLLTVVYIGGCAERAATAALATAVGIGVGVPLATRSHVEVTVEVFNETGIPQSDRVFEDPNSPLIRLAERCSLKGSGTTPSGVASDVKEAAASVATVMSKKSPELAADKEFIDLKMLAVQASEDLKTLADDKLIRGLTRAPNLSGPLLTIDKSIDYVANSASFTAAEKKQVDDARKTIDDVLLSVNRGPLANEVTQVVLCKGRMLDAITDDKNAKNWKPFAKAVSEGGAGDHTAVIYLENMATPMLKSSHFDPSELVKAFGKVYQTAFTQLAKAYGVGDVTAGAPTGTNVVASGYRKSAAQAKNQAERKKLIAQASQLLKIYTDSVKGKTTLTDAEKQDIAAKMKAVAIALEN